MAILVCSARISRETFSSVGFHLLQFYSLFIIFTHRLETKALADKTSPASVESTRLNKEERQRRQQQTGSDWHVACVGQMVSGLR